MTMDQTAIELIYEGPLEAEPWRNFLAFFQRRLGASGVSLNCRLPEPGDRGYDISIADADVQALRADYAAGQHADNPFNRAVLDIGKAHRWSDFVAPEAFHASAFFREFCQPAGFEYAVCVPLQGPDGRSAWLYAVRNASSTDFDAATLAWCETLAPHFERALRIFARLKTLQYERATFEMAMHPLHIGAIVLDRRGRVLTTNRSAEAILAAGDGVALRDDRLHFANAGARERFSAALASLAGEITEPAMEVLSVPRTGRPPLGLLARPFPDYFQFMLEPRPAVLLYLTDPAAEPVAPEPFLQSLFGLTKSEARLTTLLVDGHKLAAAAAAMDITEGSARIYCKRIFAKMGVSRQTDLVKMVLNSVAVLSGMPAARSPDSTLFEKGG
jgi:DNA-binding CsgD family transcriptional regulator